ncbi:TIGR02710 family CRISPR-associated CARF protein [Ignavibacterium sp.]|uniref:TIGR02710 family CRISPR-associated CARF protein n=1 Tax=Ignavibacterium sp. TaxID=2651167 RepID=UPI00307EB289
MVLENKTKKVLIMTIGTGANGEDIAHGLFFSIKDANPNLLVLIGSDKSFELTLPHLGKLIKNEGIDCEIIEKQIDEIDDFEKLHFKYSEFISELLKNGFALNKISVDYTSGTKAMSAALVSAAISKGVGSIIYVYGERGEGGRVKSGTERRNSLAPNKIFSDNILHKAIEHFNSYRFTTSVELINNFDIHPDYKEKSTLLVQLAKLFNLWDKFDFVGAVEVLKKIDINSLKIFELKEKFEKYYQPILFRLKIEQNSEEQLEDLVGNALRRSAEGKYDDAIARLYRALEMQGQIEFSRQFNCSTSDVNVDNIPEEFRDEVRSKYFDKKDNKIKIPLYGTFELLAVAGNKTGILFNEKWTEIQKLLSLRNRSILAHGNLPLNKKNFEDALKIVESFISLSQGDYAPIKFPELK